MGLQLTNICTIFLSLDSDRNTLAEDEYFDIQEQHLTYGHRQCHNPRDKVYGLLALVGNISKVKFWLTPNYSRSEHHVFYDATRAMLYRDRSSLKCLTGAQYGAGEGKWASWVRDFGTPLIPQDADVGSNRLMLYDLFDASNGTKARDRDFKTWPQRAGEKLYQVGLEVRAKRLGTVSTICADIREGDSEESEQGQKRVFQQWIDAAQVDLSERIDGQYYSDTVVRFWRTMLGGVLSVGKENTQYSDWRLWTIEALSWIGPFLRWMQAGQKDLPFALGRTLIIATSGRCYFRTESGGHGLCYPTTQASDEIWVFDGSNVPFVLRRVQLSEVESLALRPEEAYSVDESGTYGLKDGFEPGWEISEFHELVGDCYLDGYMSGEAAEIAKRFIVLV
jgi:hypothetical protein